MLHSIGTGTRIVIIPISLKRTGLDQSFFQSRSCLPHPLDRLALSRVFTYNHTIKSLNGTEIYWQCCLVNLKVLEYFYGTHPLLASAKLAVVIIITNICKDMSLKVLFSLHVYV